MKSVDQYFTDGNKKIFHLDYCGALLDYNNAIGIDPSFNPAYINRGYVKSKLNDFNGEIDDYTSALKIDPFNELARSNRGIARLRLNDYSGAKDDLSSLIELNPKNAHAYYYRAIARDKLSDENFQEFIGSVSDIIKAYEFDHSLQITKYSKKFLSDRMLRYIHVIQKYTREIDAWVNIEDSLVSRGELKEHATDYVGAIADFTKVIEINANNEQAYFKRANVYFMFHKDYAKAIEDYDKALEIRPLDEEFLDMRACAKFELGDLQGSLADLNQIIEQYDALDPESKESVEDYYLDAIHDKLYIKSILNDLNGALEEL